MASHSQGAESSYQYITGLRRLPSPRSFMTSQQSSVGAHSLVLSWCYAVPCYPSWVAKHLTWTPSYFAGIQTPHGRHCPKWPGTDQVSHPTVRLGILELSWRKCPGFSVKSMDAVFEISTWISTGRRRTQAIGPETSMASLLKHVGTSSMSQKSGPDPGSIDVNVIIGETRCPSPHESEKWSRPESSSSKPD